MSPGVARWAWAVATLAGLVAVSVLLLRFPWQHTFQVLAAVNVGLLATALLINLLSPLAKGWAWHLLLKPVAPNRWWVAEEANLIGTAVNSIAAGVSGEAARISLIMRRDTVPLRPAVLSVVWSRGVEALGLGLFLVLAPLVLELPAPLRGLQIGAGAALVAALALTRVRGLGDLIAKLPASLRAGAAELAEMSWGGRLIAPTALALVSWAAEWATFHLTLRVTPANVGVMQAALVGALVPFGVAADQAVAGGLALQAIEVLPVLALALAVAGRTGLAPLMAATGPREAA